MKPLATLLLIAAVALTQGAPAGAQATAEALTEDSASPTAAEGPARSPDEIVRLWWGEIRDELLAGIELSAEQKRQVDAIGERAGKDALESLRLQRSLAAAQRGGDAERERLLRGEIRRFAWRASPRGAWTR